MRIARIELEGSPVTAVVDGDSVRPVPGVEVLDLLTAAPEERERRAAAAGPGIPLGDVRLLSPIEPASVRDFSVFEQHGEGASMCARRPRRQGRRTRGTRDRRSTSRTRTPRRAPATSSSRPPSPQRPRPRAGGRRRHRSPRAEHLGGGGERLHRGLHDLQRLVRARTSQRRRHACRSAFTRPRTSPTPSARGSSRRTSSIATATATG